MALPSLAPRSQEPDERLNSDRSGVQREQSHETDPCPELRGEITELLDDMLELKPTIFTSVPRLYNRIYDRVMGTIRAGNPVARRLFAMAYASKRAALEQGDLSGGRFGPFWDRLVFSKIKARLGGPSPMHGAQQHCHCQPDYGYPLYTTKNRLISHCMRNGAVQSGKGTLLASQVR